MRLLLTVLIFVAVDLSWVSGSGKNRRDIGDIGDDDLGYGVVIDMGSKGSRVSVFVWPLNAEIPYTEIQFGGGKNPWYSKITPGVSTFATKPEEVGTYMKPLFDFAATNVPAGKHATTPVFMRGTDNLRQLPTAQSQAILSALENYVAQNYDFLLTPNAVGLLSGILEGGFFWTAANYLQQRFHDDKSLLGTLDMGSGSTQIAFIPKSGTVLPENYYYLFTFDDTNFNPYVHSFTGYGYISTLYAINLTVVQSSSSNVVYNPCLLSGYSSPIYLADRTVTMEGTGSWSLCSALTLNYLNKSQACSYPPCSFSGTYQPALKGNFMAVSNFVDVVNILGFSGSVTLQSINDGGIKYCSMSLAEVQQLFPGEDPVDLATYCYGANYITTLLGTGYGFTLDTSIDFAKNYDKAPYTWALGEMIFELQMGW